MTWMSPAYPVGAFSYSGGIEWAVEAGDIRSADTLCRWLTSMIRHGTVFCDAPRFSFTPTAPRREATTGRSRRGRACGGVHRFQERLLETTAQAKPSCRSPARVADAALDRYRAWTAPRYPVVVAAACVGTACARPALHAFLHQRRATWFRPVYG